MGNNVSIPDELVAEVLRYYISNKYVDAKLFCYWCMVLTRSVCSIRRVANICKMVFVDESLAHKYLTEIINNNDLHFYYILANINQSIFKTVQSMYYTQHVGDMSAFEFLGTEKYIRRIGLTEFKFYLDYDPTFIDKRNNDGTDMLSMACSYSYKEIASLLINTCKNINAKDMYGGTYLMLACRNNNMDIVIDLIKAGAYVNEKNDSGHTALMYACIKGNTETVSILIKTSAKINEKSATGCTALMYACYYNNKKIVSKLIQVGADINEKNNSGCTALMIVRLEIANYMLSADKLNSYTKIVKLLLAAGATE